VWSGSTRLDTIERPCTLAENTMQLGKLHA
jgi:hypothetical protein